MLTIRNLLDSAVSHPPSAWEELAVALEQENRWASAMKAWEKAMQATAGHNRRDRYRERAEHAKTRIDG